MEVLKFTDILGKTLDGDVVEGRMVRLTHLNSADLGGANTPSTLAEAALARYVVAWPVDNRQLPIYQPYPTYTQALRYGFDQTANVPFSPTYVYTLYPGLADEPLTIPSGTSALLYDEGEFIVTSGNWVYAIDTVVGDELEVNYTGANRGKLQKKSAGTAVAIVTGLPTGEKLQFRTYGD